MDILLRGLTIFALSFPAFGVKLPPDMSQGIFCECCSAVMIELNKILAKKSSDPRELQVVEAMEDICQVKYFSTYDYAPPTTIKACKFLIEKYEEDIEKVLIDEVEGTEKKVCYELTKACDGVDRTKKEKEKLDFRFNDQKQELKTDDDGIQRMNVDINDPGAAARVADQIRSQLGQQAMGAAGARGRDDDDGNHSDDDDDTNEEDGEGKEAELNEKTEL